MLILAFVFFLWTTGLLLGWKKDMEVGELAQIHCTPDYAYGVSGFPDWGIEPNSELMFEIEVLSIKD